MKRTIAIVLALMLFTGVFVGCQPAPTTITPYDEDTASTTPTTDTTTVPETESTRSLIGAWDVQSQEDGIVYLEFFENGALYAVAANDARLNGRFAVENETAITMMIANVRMVGTVTFDGDSVTIITDNGGTMVLTKK